MFSCKRGAELVYVKCHGQQQEFSLHLYFPTQKKAPESHVLFEHPEGSFDLDRAVRTQQNAFICFNASFHLHTLPLEALGNIEIFATLFKGNLTSAFLWTFPCVGSLGLGFSFIYSLDLKPAWQM